MERGVFYNSSLSKGGYSPPVYHPWEALSIFVRRTCEIIRHAGIGEDDRLGVFFRFGPYTLAHHLVLAAREMKLDIWPYGLPYSTPIQLLQRYVHEIQPSVVAGLPSTLFFLARVGLKIENCRTILTAGEYLPNAGAHFLEHHFGGNLFDHFGTTEIPSMTYTCKPCSQDFHVFDGVEAEFSEGGSSPIFRDRATNRCWQPLPQELTVTRDSCDHCCHDGLTMRSRGRISYFLGSGQEIRLSDIADELAECGCFEFFIDEEALCIEIVDGGDLDVHRIVRTVRRMDLTSKVVDRVPYTRSGKTRI